MRRLLAFFLGFVAATPGFAQGPVGLFSAWAQEAGADVSSIHVLTDGVPSHRLDADRPLDLASNSKAITALCVLSLVDEGRLMWDTTLEGALDREAPAATMSELVTHTSGIGRDSTQLRMGFWLNETQPRHAHVTDIVLDRNRQRATRGVFSYNNENYALLGRVIEMMTGQSYVDACQSRVLGPADVSATLSPRFGAYAAWGGWRMSMKDHSKLLWHWFGPEGRVGRDPLALPHVERAQNSYYGLGMNYEIRERGIRMSHAGAISIPFGPKTGAYAVVYPFGVVSAMGYDVAVADPKRFHALSDALEQALSNR